MFVIFIVFGNKEFTMSETLGLLKDARNGPEYKSFIGCGVIVVALGVCAVKDAQGVVGVVGDGAKSGYQMWKREHFVPSSQSINHTSVVNIEVMTTGGCLEFVIEDYDGTNRAE